MTIVGFCILYWVLHIMFGNTTTTHVKDDAAGGNF